MKKTLIALAVLGATAGIAQAQSSVTIYGIADVGFVKASHTATYMDENVNNRIGFMGSEDLGGGLKATFQLEHRFDLFNGAQRGAMFDGASNIGLAGSFGQVRVGRVNQLSTETYRTLDPFYQYGVAGMEVSELRTARMSNTIRYDSANFSGFKLGASYSMKAATTDNSPWGVVESSNAGYAVSATYTNGPAFLVANYDKRAGLDNSYLWNVGGAYTFGPLKVALGYEHTKLTADYRTNNNNDVPTYIFADGATQRGWLVGAEYTIGAGRINAAYSQVKFGDNLDNGDSYINKATKYALGYTHNLSKRTSVYANYAHEKLVDAFDDSTSINAVQVGMTHKF